MIAAPALLLTKPRVRIGAAARFLPLPVSAAWVVLGCWLALRVRDCCCPRSCSTYTSWYCLPAFHLTLLLPACRPLLVAEQRICLSFVALSLLWP